MPSEPHQYQVLQSGCAEPVGVPSAATGNHHRALITP